MPVSPSRFLTVVFTILALLGTAARAQSPLDAEAQAFLKAHGPVRLAPDPDFAPVDFVDGAGRHRGLSAELLDLLARRSGMEPRRVIRPSFGDALAALQAAEVDVVSGVFISPARAGRFLFSSPYLKLPAALIARREGPAIASLADLKGRGIAVVQGAVWQELLTSAGFVQEQRPAADIAAALALVAQGEADAYLGDLLSADPVLRRQRLDDALLVTGESGLEAGVAFAIRPDLPQLQRVFDQALASVTVDEESALRARWQGADALRADEEVVEVPASGARTLQQLLAEVDAASTLPDAEREGQRQAIAAAQAFEAQADQQLLRIEQMRREAEQAAADVERLQAVAPAAAAEDLLRWRGSLPQRASIAELEQLLLTEQTVRGSLQETVERLSQRAEELQQRPASLRRELEELRTQLDALAIPPALPELAARIAHAAAMSQTRALRAAMAAAMAEQGHLELLAKATDLRRRERQRALALRAERVSVLEQSIAERADQELVQELALWRATAEQHAAALPPIRDLAAENLASGESLARLLRRLAELREQAQRLERQQGEVGRALTNARERIAIGGVTESVGMLLLAERRRLPNLSALRAQLTALQREHAELQLAQVSLAEERDRLGDLPSALARLSDSDVDGGAELSPEQRATLTELLLARTELLPRVLQAQQKAAEVLQDSETRLGQLLEQSQALARLMEQNLLWIPSHRAVDALWWQRVGEGWRDLLGSARWSQAWQRLSERLPHKPLWMLGLLLPVALLLARKRWLRRLAELARRLCEVREDRFRYTLQALALTALLAAPMTVAWWLLGHMLQSVGIAGQFTESLGGALLATAPHLYLYAFLSVLCREDGVAHIHLRWLRARREAITRLRWFWYLLVLPLLFVVELSLLRDIDAVNSSVLRSALVLLLAVLAALCGWLLAPGRLFASRVAGADPRPLLRRALRAGVVGGLLVMALLPLAGYVYTSATLLGVFLDTLQVLLAVTLAHGLVLRWLVIGERRIALAQHAKAAEPEHSDAGMDVPKIGLDTVNLRSISDQSRSLLRATTIVLLGSGLLWSLADVAPAFALLDQVVLWQASEVVDGANVVRATSLGDVLLALLALVLGVTAARNVPGLLEIVLLRRFTEDASVRYAAVAVTRYLISFLVIVAVFGLLGVRWGHLQWLAAAFSVGLGFGLQEIFGNFVSGLILLFERPFRVGDTVTIGELSGTVRRVNTRATTIVDFDGKDIVIPNKTFITERFVNWTLSDTVTRIVLRIGVAYDSDPDQVRATLLELAHAHPAVLREPPPVALLVLLGPSTLDFELRCFVDQIGDRLRTTDDLHTRIIARFRERGIRMAYPQMDVHLHPPASADRGAQPGS